MGTYFEDRAWCATMGDPIADMRKAIEAIKTDNVGRPTYHNCDVDGHIEQFLSRRCAYCFQVIRELTPEENQFRFGEFFV